MNDPLRYNIADVRLKYTGRHEPVVRKKGKVSIIASGTTALELREDWSICCR